MGHRCTTCPLTLYSLLVLLYSSITPLTDKKLKNTGGKRVRPLLTVTTSAPLIGAAWHRRLEIVFEVQHVFSVGNGCNALHTSPSFCALPPDRAHYDQLSTFTVYIGDLFDDKQILYVRENTARAPGNSLQLSSSSPTSSCS